MGLFPVRLGASDYTAHAARLSKQSLIFFSFYESPECEAASALGGLAARRIIPHPHANIPSTSPPTPSHAAPGSCSRVSPVRGGRRLAPRQSPTPGPLHRPRPPPGVLRCCG